MIPTCNLRDEYNLAMQDKEDMSRISGEMTLYYEFDEAGLDAVYHMAGALTELGCKPVVTQGPVTHAVHGKCFELKTGLLSLRLMDVVKDTLDLRELSSPYTGFKNFESVMHSAPRATAEQSPFARQLEAVKSNLARPDPSHLA